MGNMSTLGKNTLGEKFGPYNSSGLFGWRVFSKENSSINVFKQNENLNARRDSRNILRTSVGVPTKQCDSRG